jgi:hypothetical protein
MGIVLKLHMLVLLVGVGGEVGWGWKEREGILLLASVACTECMK